MRQQSAAEQRLQNCFHVCAERAWRLAYSWLRDSHEAYDAVQQAFLVAAKKSDQIPARNPWPWFSVVVAHEARNARRKRRLATNSEALDQSKDADMSIPHPGSSASDQPDPLDPLEAAINQEAKGMLWQALESLPQNERDAIVLTRIGGMSHQDAASVLAMPRKTLTSHVRRGMDRLKQRIGVEQEPLKHMLVGIPVAIPPGGWESALGAWKASAGLSAASSSGLLATSA